jgi:CBS domain-containing protein
MLGQVFFYMTADPSVGTPRTPLRAIAALLARSRFSALPIVDNGALVGVVSRTDLLRLGIASSALDRSVALAVPDIPVGDVMTRHPLTVVPSASLPGAARQMIEHHVHRLFVVDCGQLVGVISALDLTEVVRDRKIATPLHDVMTRPIIVIDAREPRRAAIELLERSGVTALVVVDGEWPVGVFSQVDAVASRDLPRETPLEDVVDACFICMPDTTPLHRAAAQAAQLDVRRVIACRRQEPAGIVSGTDFVRAIAQEL